MIGRPQSAKGARIPVARSWKAPSLDGEGLDRTVFSALREARRVHGGETVIVEDEISGALSYDRLIEAASVLGARISRTTRPGETVGLMAPTSVAAVVAFFALHAIGRTPALLNFQAGAANLEAACALAGVRRILTSRRFVEAAGLKETVAKLEPPITFLYLETLRGSLGWRDKLFGLARSRLPWLFPERAASDDVAAVLFTSGTTGTPKGVALSHANLIANIAQCRAHVPFKPEWAFFNALPVFHAFGLTGGALLPILGGMRAVLYPSPLDRKRIPQRIAETGANVLVSTDTFARHYARAAAKGALSGLRYVVLGGEKVNAATRDLLAEKSPALVLEGYGASECGPVVAFNQPGADRPGSVGRLLPGMEARLDPVEGIAAGLRLSVRGPNVMLGYLDPEAPGRIAPCGEGWFDTGDLAERDEDGFITITGRVKRFAKVGAEMVSLNAVEERAAAIWPDARHAAVALARADKGETIVLLTDAHSAERSVFARWASVHDAPGREIPDRILVVRRVPLLPTGKPDYARARRIAKRRLGDGRAVIQSVKVASNDDRSA